MLDILGFLIIYWPAIVCAGAVLWLIFTWPKGPDPTDEHPWYSR